MIMRILNTILEKNMKKKIKENKKKGEVIYGKL